MSNVITIKKGLDIPLEGKASGDAMPDKQTDLFAIVPDDFPGYTWKVAVKPGDNVETGSPLLYAKESENIRIVSPVTGTVEEIHRGERRKIEYVSIRKSGSTQSIHIEEGADLLASLKLNGLFALMRQRPFDIVPSDTAEPRDIFITAFDTAPLAPAIIDAGQLPALEEGIKVLKGLTHGKVYLSVPEGSGITSSAAEVYEFKGPHPAGNVGTQIAAIKPVNKGETVWTLDAMTAVRIGEFASKKRLDFSAKVAVTGPCIANPHYIGTTIGAKLSTILEGDLKKDCPKCRVISGNVLTGYKESLEKGYLRYPYRQVTVIEEGDHADEFMGWASMNPKKYSVSRTFPAFLRGLSKPFDFDARIKGGHRAMILSGEYDKVFPFDIYPEFLIKAILAKNIEKMEQRGIYEVAPEDFALPEFVDTSKLELQKIVRDGLDYLRKETM